MKRIVLRSLLMTAAPLLFSALASAQSNTGTTTLSVTVGPEASLTVTTGTTSLATAGTVFNAFTGITNYNVKMRSTVTGGGGTLTLKVTTDFAGAGGPSVLAPPTAGDLLTYTCAAVTSGTPCTGPLTASTTTATSVATFGTNAHSAAAGDGSSVSWSLVNDPQYKTGTYTATVTLTVSAT